MLQKISVSKFKWFEDNSQFNDFLKSYNKESKEGYFLKFDVEDPENLHELHNYLPILPERIEKVDKLATNLHDETEYVIHIKTL